MIQFADDTSIVCCGERSSLHGKVMENLQKTEEYVEMNKLTLNTNKTELIFFSLDNSDFGSVFFLQKRSSDNRKKLQITWYSN